MKSKIDTDFNDMLKQVLAATLALITLSFSINIQATPKIQKTITIGYFSLPPHVIVNNSHSKPTGAAIDFFEQEIAKRMNVKVKWTHQPLTRSLTSVKKGEIDGVISLGKNADREKYIIYPAHAFHYIQAGMLVLKEDPLNSISNVKDIEDRRIIIIKGWLESPFVVKNRDSLDLKYIYGDYTAYRLATMLLKNRTTMVYSPIVSTVLYQLKYMDKVDRVKILTLPGEGPTYSGLYTVFSPVTGVNLAIEYDKISSELRTRSDLLYKKYLDKYIN